MTKNDHGIIACSAVQKFTDTVVVKFSCGKDSCATWLRCKEFFPRIIPMYHYWCPGLSFVERSLALYEEFFGQPILRVPHPNFLNYQASGALQPPHRMNVARAFNFDSITYDEIVKRVLSDLGFHGSQWCAIGIKSNDSPIRANLIKKHGAIDLKQQFFYPVCDLSHTETYQFLQDRACPLSEDYAVFGRSFDGFQPRYIRAIREHYPEDYAVLRQWFPLIDTAFMRESAYASEKA